MNALEIFSLKGKTAVVTGGAGKVGRQLVEALAGAGARVYAASRNAAALESLAAACRERNLDVSPLVMDQGDEDSILAARERLRNEAGDLHILVNNAVSRPVSGIDAPADAFETSMRVNGTGLILTTRAMSEIMPAGGSIIGIGSIMGLVGPEPTNYEGTEMSGWHADYYFHKSGMTGLTRFWASYLGPRGIRVNAVHPGGFHSEGLPEEFVRRYVARTCLGRMANDSDLRGIIIFLASDASAYLTGANIPVDGGYTAK